MVVAMPVTAILMQVRVVEAAAPASDNTCNSPYGGTNWSNGQNGGTGFGAWSLFQTGGETSSFFHRQRFGQRQRLCHETAQNMRFSEISSLP